MKKVKQMTKRTKQELGNLLILCFNANMLEDYDVFFDYSGHVNNVSLRINKIEEEGSDCVYRGDIYISGTLFKQKEFNQAIKDWRLELLKILNPSVVLSEV